MQTVFPTLRILDYERAVAFYVRGLGFKIDWEWRHEPGFPVFMQLVDPFGNRIIIAQRLEFA